MDYIESKRDNDCLCGGKPMHERDRKSYYERFYRDGAGRCSDIDRDRRILSVRNDFERSKDIKKSMAGERKFEDKTEDSVDFAGDSPLPGKGRCVVFYASAEDRTKKDGDMQKIENTARTLAEARKLRCFGWNEREGFTRGCATGFHTGRDIIRILKKIGECRGKIAEIHILAHGLLESIVGSDNQRTGITAKANVANRPKQVTARDFSVLSECLTKNVSVFLHACSSSKRNEECYVANLECEAQIKWKSKRGKKELTGIVCCCGALAVQRQMNNFLDGGGSPQLYSDVCLCKGSLMFRGCADDGNGGVIPVKGRFAVPKNTEINFRNPVLNIKRNNFKSLSNEIDDFNMSGNYVTSPQACIAEMRVSLKTNLKLEKAPSFAEDLYRVLSENHAEASVYGHPNRAKAGINCDWMKHDKTSPEGERAKIDKRLSHGFSLCHDGDDNA